MALRPALADGLPLAPRPVWHGFCRHRERGLAPALQSLGRLLDAPVKWSEAGRWARLSGALRVSDYETASPVRWLRRCLMPNPTAVIRISAAPNETAAPIPASRKSKPDEGGTLIAVSPTVALPMFLLS